MNLLDLMHPDYSGVRIGFEDQKKAEVLAIEPYLRGKIGALLFEVMPYGENPVKDIVMSFNKVEDIQTIIDNLLVLKVKMIQNLEGVKNESK